MERKIVLKANQRAASNGGLNLTVLSWSYQDNLDEAAEIRSDLTGRVINVSDKDARGVSIEVLGREVDLSLQDRLADVLAIEEHFLPRSPKKHIQKAEVLTGGRFLGQYAEDTRIVWERSSNSEMALQSGWRVATRAVGKCRVAKDRFDRIHADFLAEYRSEKDILKVVLEERADVSMLGMRTSLLLEHWSRTEKTTTLK